MTVVSGLALGIDTVAHRTAIEVGGRTIAVLATPLDDVTPRQNTELQRLIMHEHLAISQFPPGHPILRSNYPRRNRTMALISDATVIVEAGDGSGSLYQGWEALRLGRPLFLMRSIVESATLKWPSEMLHYGAGVLDAAQGGPRDQLEVSSADRKASMASTRMLGSSMSARTSRCRSWLTMQLAFAATAQSTSLSSSGSAEISRHE